MFIAASVSSVQSAMDVLTGDKSVDVAVKMLLNFSQAGLTAGVVLGFALEHPLGGKLWLVFTPALSTALILTGASLLPGAGSSHASWLSDMLTVLVDFVIAVAITAGWLVFLLEYFGKYRLATTLVFLCEVLAVLTVLTGAVLAVVSDGTKSSLLVMSAVLIGLAVAVRGATRLKKLAKILRV